MRLWEVRSYELEEGTSPLGAFLERLQPKHAAKVWHVIERLRIFGPELPFPHASDVTGTPFRELRTTFAGQQYRVLYRREGDVFVLYIGFHKTSDRDLDRAVNEATKYLET